MNAELIESIEKASGLNAKTAVARTARGETYELLRLVFDPYVTFGVTVAKKDETFSTPGTLSSDEFGVSLLALLRDHLAPRKLTGGKAAEAVQLVLSGAPTAAHRKWACRVINKDLKAGLGVKSWLKAFPGSVQPFEVQLAADSQDKCMEDYEDAAGHLQQRLVTWPLWDLAAEGARVEPKLDGLRCIGFVGSDEPSPGFLTRNGREIFGIDHLTRALSALPGRWVIDGEGFGTAFEDSISMARTQVRGDSALKLYCFDLLTRAEWDAQQAPNLADRRLRLRSLHQQRFKDHAHLLLVPQKGARTVEEIERLSREFEAAGYEGSIVKRPSGGYTFDRSISWTKVKFFRSDDFEVLGTYEGEGKRAGKLGGLLLKLPWDCPEGYVVGRCGTGFDDGQLTQLWEMREELVGQVAEIKFQSRTPDGSFRFPTFRRFRPDKRKDE